MFKQISKALSQALNWLAMHVKEVIGAALGIGAVAAADGAANIHRAKKINKKADAIQRAAIERVNIAFGDAQAILTELGTKEKTVIDSFVHFADTIEKIQNRPKIKPTIFSQIKLPTYEPEEIKKLAADMEVAMAAAGGAGVGVIAGLAAFGAEAIVAAPAILGVGFVLCAKGISLKKKAVKNVRQAMKLSKDVEPIIAFYNEVGAVTASFTESLWTVYTKYDFYLRSIDELLLSKTKWEDFSRQEKNLVKNTIYLAALLFNMCKTKIITKNDDEMKIDIVNSTQLTKLEKQAKSILEKVET